MARTRAESAVESMNATPAMSRTTAPSVLAARSIAYWTFGAVEVDFAAHRDDGVGFGVFVYADLEVHAGPDSSLQSRVTSGY